MLVFPYRLCVSADCVPSAATAVCVCCMYRCWVDVLLLPLVCVCCVLQLDVVELGVNRSCFSTYFIYGRQSAPTDIPICFGRRNIGRAKRANTTPRLFEGARWRRHRWKTLWGILASFPLNTGPVMAQSYHDQQHRKNGNENTWHTKELCSRDRFCDFCTSIRTASARV